MKRLAKILCLVLTLCMVLSIAPLSVFADAEPVAFTDVTGHWAEPYITVLANTPSEVEDGYVVNGYGNGTFRPDQYITRAEIAKILDAAFGFETTGESKDFPDVAKTSWAYKYVMACADNGIVKGYPDGTFKPSDKATREQAITMIARCILTDEELAEYRNDADLSTMFKDASKIHDYARAACYFLATCGNLEGYPDGTVKPQKNITRAEFVKLLFAAADENVYALNVTITDNKGNKVSDSTANLTGEDLILDTLVPMISANRDKLKAAFPSSAMAAIMDEGVAIAKSGDETAWAKFVDTYANDVSGAKEIFADFYSVIGDMTPDQEYQMTFKDTAEGRTDIVYTVTISVEVIG